MKFRPTAVNGRLYGSVFFKRFVGMTPTRSSLRLEAFQRALRQLQRAVDTVESFHNGDLSLEEEGMIQRFEYCFELGWKLLKDLAKEANEGADELHVRIGGPRDAIRWGVASGWVQQGEVWMDMLRSRNLTSHYYDRDQVQPTLNKIRMAYLHALHEFRISVEDAQAAG